MYNICQAKTFSTSLDTIRPAVGEIQSESGVILGIQIKKSYVANLAPNLNNIQS
jgi:hypothetical protein